MWECLIRDLEWTVNTSSIICTVQWFTGLLWPFSISFHCFLSFIRVAYVIWAVTFISILCLAPCHSQASLFSMSLTLLHFFFHHLLCHPLALPKCLHVRALSPDLCVPTGASPVSHHLLHMPALNLSLCPLWFFGNNATWDVGTEVGWLSAGLSDRAFELSWDVELTW